MKRTLALLLATVALGTAGCKGLIHVQPTPNRHSSALQARPVSSAGIVTVYVR